MSQTRPFALQVRSSAGLYGADRVVLALNHALPRSGARGRLLSINNYRMHEQALHDTASATGQDAVLLPCRGRVDPATVGALAAQIGAVRDRDGTPPIVHVHDYKSAFYAWLATRREVHLGTPAPLVATLHGWVEGSTSLRLYTRLELALLRRFDALVVVAGEQIDRLGRAGVPRSRVAPHRQRHRLPGARRDRRVRAARAIGPGAVGTRVLGGGAAVVAKRTWPCCCARSRRWRRATPTRCC